IDDRARSGRLRYRSGRARLDPFRCRSGAALRRGRDGRASDALVVPLHELLPALAAVARILDGEVVPILALEPVGVAALSLRRGAAQDERVAVPLPARGNRGRKAHAVEPVPGDVVCLSVPAEPAVAAEE